MSPTENKYMKTIGTIEDAPTCARLWKHFYPRSTVFDLWEVREIFARHFGRRHCFVVHYTDEKDNVSPGENGVRLKIKDSDINAIDGVLPLSWIEEKKEFAFFPGETWKDRTWLEQNKIIAPNKEVMTRLIHGIPGAAELRYLCPPPWETGDKIGQNGTNAPVTGSMGEMHIDEVGYLFHPANHGIKEEQYPAYLLGFAGKSRKKILAEIHAIEKKGVKFRYNVLEDIELLFQFNQDNFKENGYFHDPRFLNAFRELAQMLHQKKMLRVVTVLVDNKTAAVDMAAVWNHTCFFLAGGTSRTVPGIAKLINLHHIQWACSHTHHLGDMPLEEIHSLDFLCGDFGWKERFHLSPRPLYKIIVPEKGHGYAPLS
ncbi:GNAT family N-acetyltransferase [Desulfocicer vacuolatum]|nr:GNAT family N-acetyltransferase [Desulfocicer vacuolatum]